jgi:hypothetical protein
MQQAFVLGCFELLIWLHMCLAAEDCPMFGYDDAPHGHAQMKTHGFVFSSLIGACEVLLWLSRYLAVEAAVANVGVWLR